MGDNEFKSKLEMISFYFPAYSFKFKGNGTPLKLLSTYNIDYAEKDDDRNQVKIQIVTTIFDEEKNFDLSLTALGFFRLERENFSEEIANEILKKNTVAIMMPFIRSQVSLLTTQPGLTPILLQPIDVNALVDNAPTESK